MKTQQSMSDQLNSLAPNMAVRRTVDLSLPSFDLIGLDGEHHININDKAATTLGKALCHTSNLDFIHSVYGKFNSMEGFWFYIRSQSGDDSLRKLNAIAANKFGKNLAIKQVKDFRLIIAEANWQKIKAYPLLKEELKALTLPLDSYYVHNQEYNIRIRLSNSLWIVAIFHEIRLALQQEREPDFQFLSDEQQGIGTSNVKDKKINKTTHASFYLKNIYSNKEEPKVVKQKKQPALQRNNNHSKPEQSVLDELNVAQVDTATLNNTSNTPEEKFVVDMETTDTIKNENKISIIEDSSKL